MCSDFCFIASTYRVCCPYALTAISLLEAQVAGLKSHSGAGLVPKSECGCILVAKCLGAMLNMQKHGWDMEREGLAPLPCLLEPVHCTRMTVREWIVGL